MTTTEHISVPTDTVLDPGSQLTGPGTGLVHDGGASAVPPPPQTRFRRIVLGPPGDPSWARPAIWLLLLGVAVLYLVNITASGYGNDFYAAAVKSSTESWKAWLFASLDSGNGITVDKPPAAMWIMGLSGRIFGFSSASMLIPEALMGVGAVAVLYAAVKRWAGPEAGLLAGGLLALTPVAAMMFRYNNPDALLTLLMTVAAYCVIRAIDAQVPSKVRSRALTWLLLAGTAIGFAFLTKMLQGLLVLPGLGVAYLIAAPRSLWTRIWHLLAAFGAVIVSGGWFVVLVALWPASSRPYIGGSTDNSLWELAIGYNGLGRIFGNTGGGGAATGGQPGGGGFGGGMFGGATGITRMFGTAFGSQISWLLPAALVALVAGLIAAGRAVRTDRLRAAMVLWGGWTIVTAVVFSFMQGTTHPYYSIALAPGIAGLVAVGGREMWRRRNNVMARSVLAAMIAVTAVWSFYLMQRDAPTWNAWLRYVILIAGVAGAVLLAVSAARLKKLAVVGLVVGSAGALAGMTGWTMNTVSKGYDSATPTAGPASAAGGFGGRGGVPNLADLPAGLAAQLREQFGNGPLPSGLGAAGQGPAGSARSTLAGGGAAAGAGRAGSADPAVVKLLEATSTRWAAATSGSQSADLYILATDKAVLALGGFTGSDPYPTLDQFKTYVAAGQVTYFLSGGGGFGGGGFGGGRGDGAASAVSTWVQQNFKATTVGTATVYDLRSPITKA